MPDRPVAELPTRLDIEAAMERVAPWTRRTPVIDVGTDPAVTLKLEFLQHTGSFKPRGAFNRVLRAQEDGELPEAGIIAASGGNHGAAVAHVGGALGVPTEVFVPATAPPIKLERLRDYPAVVTEAGQLYDDAQAASDERAAETGALIVHPYDLTDVLAGQGTIGLELEARADRFDTVLVAVGGGGLIGGVASWFRGDVRIVAVEPEHSRCLGAALEVGRPVPVEVAGVASDSLGARQVGRLAFAAASQWVDRAITVTDDEIVAAQRALWAELRIVAEPGGATAWAALRSGAYEPASGERVALLVCGANAAPGPIAKGR